MPYMYILFQVSTGSVCCHGNDEWPQSPWWWGGGESCGGHD